MNLNLNLNLKTTRVFHFEHVRLPLQRDIEMLLEVGESWREIRIVEGQDVAARIQDELLKTLHKDIKLTCRGNTSGTSSADEYVLQRWSQKWTTYVAVSSEQW